jgi:class 3 adenylate cyclase/tetratricopeptide (TPR) repeat protein
VSVVCTSCGAENRAGSRFCDQCGTALARSCPGCGEPNRADARFCASCGNPIGALAAAADAAATGPGAPAVSVADAAATAERRLVTVLFADLVGFTALAEDRDPETVRDLLSGYFDAATAVVARHGGTVEKFIGDAVMAVWGTPVAHEDDAERAVRAALEVVDAVRALSPGLEARSAVMTGEAAVTIGARNQGMVAGDLVNTAARLQGVAEPGTVLVGEATMRAASDSVVFEAVRDHSLKGKTSPVPAWRAMRVVSGRSGQGRADTLEAPFVGRDEDLRLLKDQLHAVGREGRIRLVSITGPAGIGKSRLVWELEKYIDGVAEDVYWHRGRSPSYGEGIAFWALGEMIRRRAGLPEDADEVTTRQAIAATLEEYLPDAGERDRIAPALLSLLGVEPAPPGGRETLFPAWRLFFERIAARGTTVLVFEDLQWADAGLVDFVDHLIDWSRGLPILVVTLARPELFTRRPEWGAGRRHFTALALEPLGDAAMRDLLGGLVPGLPPTAIEAIVRRADGIPLYAVETVRALLADGRIERVGDSYRPVGDLSNLSVPESLRSLIASRLDALDADDRSLLQEASVLGQVFPVEDLAAIAGRSSADVEARLRDLARRELVDLETDPRSPERGQYKFVQSLIREVAYGTLSRRDRRARHLAVARHYEATADEEQAGALASHYLAAHSASEAGPEADAIATQARLALSGAAARAAALGAHDQAVAYLEQALAITVDARDRAALLERASESGVAASRADAERHAREAIAAYDEIGDEAGSARASARLGKVLIDIGNLPPAVDTLEATLPAAERIGDRAVLAETLAHLARAYMRTAANEQAVAAADKALSIAEVDNLEPIVVEALVNKGSALSALGRRREAVALLQAALSLAERTGLRQLEMRIRNNLASSMTEDDPAGATRLVEESMAVAAEIGDRGHYAWLLGTASFARYFEGRAWDEQLAAARDALAVSTVSYERVRLRAGIALFEAARGENLDGILADVVALIGDDDSPDMRSFRYLVAADLAFVRRDFVAAYDDAMRSNDPPTQNPELSYIHAARAALHARDLERLRTAQAALDAVPLTGPLTMSSKDHVRATVLALEGKRTEALELFRRGIDVNRRFEQRFEAARMILDAAVALPTDPEVRRWAAEAASVFEDLRATSYVELLDAALVVPESPTPARATVPDASAAGDRLRA